MKTIVKRAISNPLFWFAGVLTFFMLQYNLPNDGLKNVVRSDGRGYYAYLPALLIFNDPDYAATQEAEKRITGANDVLYLYKDAEGKIHNKYFPGVAILQSPFFGMACATSWLFNKEVNGYSNTFQLFFLLGNLIYCILGIWLFYHCLKRLFPEQKRAIRWLLPLIYIATPLWYYAIVAPSNAHMYSFFLFGLFTWIALRLRKDRQIKSIFFLGIVVGLIVLVRPTNAIVALLLPFFLGSVKMVKEVWKDLIAKFGLKIWSGLFGFFSMIVLLLVIWRWQSGEWFVWSYKGEGFNWLQPQIWANLFSFRIGLFVHTPALLLSVFGTIYLYRKNRFQFIFWWIYFIVNIWVISAWWCWDYESTFGNRPNTEHIFFLILPLLYVFEKHRKLVFALMVFFTVLGFYRFQQFVSGEMRVQRYTAASYFKSLQFWEKNTDYRFNFTRSVEAFGEKIEEKELLNFSDVKEISPDDEFPMGGEAKLELPRTYERYYYRVELDKMISVDHFEGVHLVIDASNEGYESRYYRTSDLFNDRQEGKNDWKHLVFEGIIHDNFQEFEQVKIYIWNRKKQKFAVRNVKITLMKYLAE